jgi:hypothetical protein
MTIVYQVAIFKGMGESPISDLEDQLNKFLKTIPILEGDNKSPSTRLADSGNVAMVIYQVELEE